MKKSSKKFFEQCFEELERPGYVLCNVLVSVAFIVATVCAVELFFHFGVGQNAWLGLFYATIWLLVTVFPRRDSDGWRQILMQKKNIWLWLAATYWVASSLRYVSDGGLINFFIALGAALLVGVLVYYRSHTDPLRRFGEKVWAWF